MVLPGDFWEQDPQQADVLNITAENSAALVVSQPSLETSGVCFPSPFSPQLHFLSSKTEAAFLGIFTYPPN